MSAARTVTLLHGDCLSLLPTLEAASVDAIVTDPPYGIQFMGKGWDRGVPGVAYWIEARRVARAGAWLLAFGGTRTYHRLACAIEDAGWEIRDCLSWLYASGFPKAASTLKPAWEPVLVARTPSTPVTALNVDGCRIPRQGPRYEPRDRPSRSSDALGRWPTNVALDEDAAALLDAQHGHPGRPVSRFFFCAKPRQREREAGLEGMPRRAASVGNLEAAGRDPTNPRNYRDSGQRRRVEAGLPATEPRANHHPTVKPLALMRWLVRLVTPAGGVVLDPFMGSGTTGCAAVQEGLRFVGIDEDGDYVELARRRIAWWTPTQEALGLGGAA